MPSRDQRAADAFRALTAALGPGTHHIAVSAHVHDAPAMTSTAMIEVTADTEPAMPSVEFSDTMAETVMGTCGMLIARTYGPALTFTVRGWYIQAGRFHPMTADEMRQTHRTAPDGRMRGPEPGVTYAAGHPLPHPVRA
ncbi:hypothetical protein ACIP98_29250 [Streptomyces sp. NPDC088354]|uniref:hypothetical protein n=1 Tax=Streptomyces sp. NPDC088354 TaxID=3365856 RepID=UPI003818BE1A